MIRQIPQEQMPNFLPYFKDHRFMVNLLNQIPHFRKGKGFTDDLQSPELILFTIGEGFGESFLAGNPESKYAIDLLDFIPEKNTIFITDKKWVLKFKENWNSISTGIGVDYSSKGLNLDYIQNILTKTPDSFIIEKFNENNAKKVKNNLPIHYGNLNFVNNINDYFKDRIGYCLKKKEEIVAIASSAFPFKKKLEIAVETLELYRKKGLATIVCAKLIEYCLENDIDPHWNTNIYNPSSMRLAEKLGFTDKVYYRVYSWNKEWPDKITELRKAFHTMVIEFDIVDGLVETVFDKSISDRIQMLLDTTNEYIIKHEENLI